MVQSKRKLPKVRESKFLSGLATMLVIFFSWLVGIIMGYFLGGL